MGIIRKLALPDNTKSNRLTRALQIDNKEQNDYLRGLVIPAGANGNSSDIPFEEDPLLAILYHHVVNMGDITRQVPLNRMLLQCDLDLKTAGGNLVEQERISKLINGDPTLPDTDPLKRGIKGIKTDELNNARQNLVYLQNGTTADIRNSGKSTPPALTEFLINMERLVLICSQIQEIVDYENTEHQKAEIDAQANGQQINPCCPMTSHATLYGLVDIAVSLADTSRKTLSDVLQMAEQSILPHVEGVSQAQKDLCSRQYEDVMNYGVESLARAEQNYDGFVKDPSIHPKVSLLLARFVDREHSAVGTRAPALGTNDVRIKLLVNKEIYNNTVDRSQLTMPQTNFGQTELLVAEHQAAETSADRRPGTQVVKLARQALRLDLGNSYKSLIVPEITVPVGVNPPPWVPTLTITPPGPTPLTPPGPTPLTPPGPLPGPPPGPTPLTPPGPLPGPPPGPPPFPFP